ncbi:tetratricopeptide repeat protein [Striga asiatica]|uniref:Tetratricopeptide repeat protein n=1 Tax=Striga asiatica TaxID=4170 RepID=A0A5A7PEJ5_STRAF|nr:tetratricopeptide repeat protein [Striga asiatica]
MHPSAGLQSSRLLPTISHNDLSEHTSVVRCCKVSNPRPERRKPNVLIGPRRGGPGTTRWVISSSEVLKREVGRIGRLVACSIVFHREDRETRLGWRDLARCFAPHGYFQSENGRIRLFMKSGRPEEMLQCSNILSRTGKRGQRDLDHGPDELTELSLTSEDSLAEGRAHVARMTSRRVEVTSQIRKLRSLWHSIFA